MADSDPRTSIISWIIALVVIVVVAAGLYLIFKDKIIGFFENLPTGVKFILGLLNK